MKTAGVIVVVLCVTILALGLYQVFQDTRSGLSAPPNDVHLSPRQRQQRAQERASQRSEKWKRATSRIADRQRREYEAKQKADEAKVAAQDRVIEAVETMLANGAIHSIDVSRQQVRIDPLAWGMLVIEQKQQTLAMLSAYFKAKAGDGYVTVLSNRNDTVLAEYSPVTGPKVHY